MLSELRVSLRFHRIYIFFIGVLEMGKSVVWKTSLKCKKVAQLYAHIPNCVFFFQEDGGECFAVNLADWNRFKRFA